MTDPVTRREMLAGTAAVLAVAQPYTTRVSAAQFDLDALLNAVSLEVKAAERDAPSALEDTYQQVFAPYQIDHVGGVTFKSMSMTRAMGEWQHGFEWHLAPQPTALKVHVVRDDDPRDVIEKHGVVRLKDLHAVLAGMTAAHRMTRVCRALDVFNNATTYDPMIGGDGVCLCADNHPHEGGTWSNVVTVPGDRLTADALRAGRAAVEAFVDQRGLRIKVKPKVLVVPPAMEVDGFHALQALADGDLGDEPIVLDGLRNQNCAFLLTDVAARSLLHVERYPFEIGFGIDVNVDAVWVATYENGVFGCVDPRSVVQIKLYGEAA